jgi:hypothetical protein
VKAPTVGRHLTLLKGRYQPRNLDDVFLDVLKDTLDAEKADFESLRKTSNE